MHKKTNCGTELHVSPFPGRDKSERLDRIGMHAGVDREECVERPRMASNKGLGSQEDAEEGLPQFLFFCAELEKANARHLKRCGQFYKKFCAIRFERRKSSERALLSLSLPLSLYVCLLCFRTLRR